MTRDSFLEALRDPVLRLRILEREPSTLDEALKVACRLEELGRADGEESWDEVDRRKDKNRVMALQTDSNKLADERMSRLEAKLEEYKGQLEAYRHREEMRNCT